MNVFDSPDIIINIFLKMNITDLNKVATLSTLIYKVFKEEVLWKHIYDNNYVIFKNNYYESCKLCFGLEYLKHEIKFKGTYEELYNAPSLDLTNNKLASLPKEIGNCINLRRLDLDYNQLASLPKEIGNCINLRRLDLDYNQLSTLPKEIGNCINLQILSLSNNQLSTLPKEIGNCTNLQKLYLQNNPLTTIPEEVKQLDCFIKL